MGNGHLYPMLPLCSELAARGYRVTCASSDRYSRLVRATDAEPLPFLETPVDEALRIENEARAQLPVNDPSRFETTQLELQWLSRSADSFLAQIAPFYGANPPDLVLYSRYSIPGRIIAQRFDVPAVQLSAHFAYPGETRFWERGVARNPDGIVAYAAKLDALLATHGVTRTGNLWHVEPMNIHFIPGAFQYRRELFDERFVFACSPLERRIRTAWRRPDCRRPIVLISGYSGLAQTQVSNLHYFRLCIDALADAPFHCVLSIGNGFPAHALGPLPANFDINERASHLEILPHVDLLVCHGGMSSSIEALYNGVPVLGIPGTPYMEEVAWRVAELQVGTLLPQHELCARSLREAVMQMLNDRSLGERAKEMQRLLARCDPVARAADRVDLFAKKA